MTDPTAAEDQALVEAAFADRARLKEAACAAAVERTIAKLDRIAVGMSSSSQNQ